MKILSIALIMTSTFTCMGQTLSPVELVDQQLKSYNERNVDLFLTAFSDSISVYMFPSKLLYKGKDNMRKQYTSLFANLPDLHCTVKNRMILDNTVIDEERTVFKKENPQLESIAIYKIKHGKIQDMYFIMKQQ